jgi:serine/threonine kinase 16
MKLLSSATKDGKHVSVGTRTLKVKAELGQGGFAVIRLVKDKKSSERFALKSMLCRTAEQRAVALKEVAVMRALVGTRGVMPLVDSQTLVRSTELTEVLLLMPFAVAGDVQQLIDKTRADGEFIGEAVVGSVLNDVLLGLRALHACGLAHRDIKPSNFLFGEQQQLFIADFGSVSVAQVDVPDALSSARIADDVQEQTTPLFRAPELYAIHAHSTLSFQKADVWALGCSVFAMLFNVSPFEHVANEQGAVELAIQNGIYELPTERAIDTVPPELLKVMSKMLALDPRDRPTLAAITQELLGKTAPQPDAQPRTVKLVHDSVLPLLAGQKAAAPATAAATSSSTAAARAALFGDDAPAPQATAAAPRIAPSTAAERVKKPERKRPASAHGTTTLVSQESFTGVQLAPPPTAAGGSARQGMARRHGRPAASSDAPPMPVEEPSSSSSSSSSRSTSPEPAATAPPPSQVIVKLDKARLIDELRRWREAHPVVDAPLWESLCRALQAAELK